MYVLDYLIYANDISSGHIKKQWTCFLPKNQNLIYQNTPIEYTCAKQNYFKINDAIRYSSSVGYLTDFVNSQR